MIEARAVFVALREVVKQRVHGRQTDTFELPLPGWRNPFDFIQRRGGIHARTLAEGHGSKAKEILRGLGRNPAW